MVYQNQEAERIEAKNRIETLVYISIYQSQNTYEIVCPLKGHFKERSIPLNQRRPE